MNRDIWQINFKMTLYIYEGAEPCSVSVEGESVALLKEQIEELILKSVHSDGKYLVEMLIEAEGEYYDSDEQTVRVSLAENKVYYEV